MTIVGEVMCKPRILPLMSVSSLYGQVWCQKDWTPGMYVGKQRHLIGNGHFCLEDNHCSKMRSLGSNMSGSGDSNARFRPNIALFQTNARACSFIATFHKFIKIIYSLNPITRPKIRYPLRQIGFLIKGQTNRHAEFHNTLNCDRILRLWT